jgi:hypothetical protein
MNCPHCGGPVDQDHAHVCLSHPLPRPTDTDIVTNLVLCEHAHGKELRLNWCNVCGAISNDGGKTWTLPRVAAAARRLHRSIGPGARFE